MIWTFSTLDMTSFHKFLQSHVRPSLPVAVDVLQSSLLHLLLPVLHVQIRHHSRAFACLLSLALPHLAINDSHPKIVVIHVTPLAIFPIAAAFLRNALANDSLLATSLATAGDSHQGIPLLQGDRDSPSPKRQRFTSRDPPSPKRQRFASGDSPSPKRRRFASGDSDSPQRQHSSRASSGDGSVERPPIAVFSYPSIFAFYGR